MENANSIIINRFFTRNTFREIIDDGNSNVYSTVVKRIIDDPSGLSNSECIYEIYHYLKSEYRNEYFYKNTLLNKLLLGIHNTQTTTALTEVPIGSSKADFILINGKAVVYEIKTDLDNFDRLNGQISDYYKAFSRVAVVTSESNYEEICRRLEKSPTGIYILTKRGTLSERKKAEEFTDELSSLTMFKILRKYEYEKLLVEKFGTLPEVSQFEYYRACLALFESIPIAEAYKVFLKMLKERSRVEANEFEKVPYELKFLVYFSNLKKQDYSRLNTFLRTKEVCNVFADISRSYL